ncbi:RNA ligase [Streptomyces sp. NPDC002088]|uniref:RNA ligase n=1 Tax=Streptomyces sp. NPDC002088 TaxID=3154665 RepID=UPI00332AECBE
MSIMSQSLLKDMLDKGYVRKQNHPDAPLSILNYTNKAQFDSEWNDVTKKTRGLIVDSVTNEVAARPFEKFFNWSQIPLKAQAALINEPVETYVKWDGSLGVGYTLHTGEFRIATRGSFTSPQALHATEHVQSRYPDFEPILGLTYLFEIVYPANRVVVDYQGLDELILLAVVDTETGKTLPSGAYDWPGPINQPVGFQSLAEVVSAPEEKNQEGFVVRFPSSDLRVKFKFEEYVRLHRILTNVSTLSVWEALANGQGIEQFIDHVPDEFYTWVHKQVHRLEGDYTRVYEGAADDFEWVMRRVRRPEWDTKKARKEFALLASETDYPDVLFGLYDGNDVSKRIWKKVRPEFEKPYYGVSEDVA